MKQFILTSVLFFVAIVANAHKLTIHLNNVENGKGQLGVVVFGADNYMQYTNATWATIVNPEKGTTTVTCDLPAGKYAILVMHDENMNNKVDTNAQGIPTEPTGMSNNPQLKGFPTFDQLAFEVSRDASIDINMVRYIK